MPLFAGAFKELPEVIEAFQSDYFVGWEGVLGAVGESAGEGGVAGFVDQEGLVATVAGFAGEGEGGIRFSALG